MTNLKSILVKKGIGRNFFIYFFVSLFIIFTLVFAVQWSAINWFVSRYEHERITDNLMKIKQNINETEKKHFDELTKLKDIFLANINHSELNTLLSDNMPVQSMFYIFDIDNNLVYGYQWAEFFKTIFVSDNPPKNFIFFDRVSLYKVSYEQSLSSKNISYKYYLVSAYREPVVPTLIFTTHSFEALKKSTDRHHTLIYKKISNQETKQEFEVIPADNISSYGVLSLYDINNQTAMVYIHQYPREIYLFLRKFFLIIIFILLGSLVILTTISFAVISNKIFNPLWNLIDKMKHISEKPQQISPVENKTHGEIMQIYEYFNEMVLSINDYQSELSKSKELFDKINAGIFWLDDNALVKYCNKTFKEIFLLENPIGKNIKDIIPYNNEVYKWQSNKLEINPYYLGNQNKELSLTVHAHFEEDITEYIGIVYDITEESKQAKIRRSLELELIRINRLGEIGRRIQGIVHNLNTPLNSVIGFAQLMSEENPEDNDLKKIINAAKSMSDIIKLLLQKTRDDSIAMPMPININSLLKQELSFCSHDLFFKHNVQLELDFAEKLPDLNLVYGDISQVFQTIFNNAMEAMVDSEQKTLRVKSFIDEKFIGFSVEDTGCGMNEEVLNRLFEPSFSTKTLTATSGFGLGLPMAKSIIDKLHGKIEVTTKDGIGSVFTVFIPND